MRSFLASPLGYLIGVSLGALGGGGSILAVPALVYAAGQSPQAATTTSLLIVGLAALVGMATHLRDGNVRVRSGVAFVVVGLGGSIGGVRLSSHANPDAMLLAFSGLMTIAAWRMWVTSRRGIEISQRSLSAAAATSTPTLGTIGFDAATVAKLLLAGTAVGFLTGFFGVGGGFVVVPALVLALRLPMPEAIGTSLLVIAANSAFALSQRVATTGIEWHVAIPFAIAALVGIRHGSRISRRVGGEVLARWFVGLLLALAVVIATQSIFALT